ncbi:uncharacterized protein UDID_18179 [Ustilago sp. UG-2017a]|nr:uncharacterized protein UDID_18179 [Ustilago sp. UG-2017a]
MSKQRGDEKPCCFHLLYRPKPSVMFDQLAVRGCSTKTGTTETPFQAVHDLADVEESLYPTLLDSKRLVQSCFLCKDAMELELGVTALSAMETSLLGLSSEDDQASLLPYDPPHASVARPPLEANGDFLVYASWHSVWIPGSQVAALVLQAISIWLIKS